MFSVTHAAIGFAAGWGHSALDAALVQNPTLQPLSRLAATAPLIGAPFAQYFYKDNNSREGKKKRTALLTANFLACL